MSDSAASRGAGLSQPGWQVAAATALVYAVVGWLALVLAVPPSYASPLYPSAGIALVAMLTYGRIALPGVALGAFLVNVVLSASRGQIDAPALLLPAAIGVGAMLQAAAGAALLRRFVAQPLVLAGPREIVASGVLGSLLACLVSATLATAALRAGGAIGPEQIAATWGTWWVGDALGVLIGAPIALTLIGRPRDAWAPRRRTVGLPLLLATLLWGTATLVVSRWDEERAAATFEHDSERIVSDAQARLREPMQALQALHSAYLAAGGLNAMSLRDAARWWLAQPLQPQAMGFGARVPRAELPAFEARARAEGLPKYHVSEPEALGPAAKDADVVALRLLEPPEGHSKVLGVNAMSVPAARAAIERSRDSGAAVAASGLHLTQSSSDETELVLYQAVYDGVPMSAPERQARFRGVLFVDVNAERLFAGLAAGERSYLRWCLVERDASSAQARWAGPPGCELATGGEFERRRRLEFASRELELRVSALPQQIPGHGRANPWLFSVAGLMAAAMLGALLLSVTGRARRNGLAVAQRNAAQRLEVQERAHAEHALRASETRLRSILDHLPIGMMFLDTQGRVLETNPDLCQMLARPPALLLRSSLADISHPGEQAENRRHLAELLSGQVDTSRRQMRLLRGDGEVLWVRLHLSALREDDAAPPRLAGVVEDITEHLRLEESERALDRAEAANRAKSEFVSRMSHELRTPLNAMIGFAQLLGLDRSPVLAARQRDWAGQIQRAGWHLLEMINDTLDLARIESGAVQLTPRPLDLPAMISASLAMVANSAGQRGVAMHTELSGEADAVLGDETRLKQVLTNLLTNAVKYNRQDGSVVVSAAMDARGFVEIAVRDSGLGMTPEQMAALFQPYNRLGRETSGVEGTGIGLVISRRLAELMGGTLEAASVSGQGSIFTLRLPHADLSKVAPASNLPNAVLPYRQRLVHYVEDNQTNIEVMRGILAQRAQIVLEVSTFGLDGLTAIRQRRPDLILLDMQLPDISGLELLRHIKQDDAVADIPVIVVSADATTARMQEALTLGAAHYVTKPVEIAGFLRTLDEMLEGLETRWGV